MSLDNSLVKHYCILVCLLCFIVEITKGFGYFDTNRTGKHKIIPCLHDKHCWKRGTCNVYRRVCEGCSKFKEYCRRDGNCCSGLLCYYGRCHPPFKRDGSEESLCKDHTDCQAGLCCAKDYGIMICKKYKQRNEKCTLPLGGLDHSVLHECPCLHGLRCQRINRYSKDRICKKDYFYPFYT